MSKYSLIRPSGGSVVSGEVSPEFARVWEIFENNFSQGLDTGAAFSVFHKGKQVINIWGGYSDSRKKWPWQKDTLCMSWSVTKAITSICLATLVDQGRIDFDRQVAFYWPEFSQNGKGHVTVAQLLSHQAGLLALDGVKCNLSFARNPELIARTLAKQTPLWPPGSCHGYHAVTLGWYIDQLIRRVDEQHRSAGVYFREEISLPLGLDIHIGLDEKQEARVAWLDDRCSQGYRHMLLHQPRMFFHLMGLTLNCNSFLRKMQRTCGELSGVKAANRKAYRQVEQPHVNAMATASSLARLMNILANHGCDCLTGTQVLSPQTTARMLQPVCSGMDCLYQIEGLFSHMGLGLDIIINQGRRQVGHPGFGGQAAYSDAENRLTWAFLTNRIAPYGPVQRDPRYRPLLDCIYNCLDDINMECSSI